MKNNIIKDLNLLIKDIAKDNNLSISEAKKIILNALNNEYIKQLDKKELKDYLTQIINNYYLSKKIDTYLFNIDCFVIRFRIKKDYENKRYYKNNNKNNRV